MSFYRDSSLIRFEEVCLDYRIVHNQAKTLRETLINFAKRESIISNHQALSNITFSLNEGETLALVGRNGAGKSTLLKCIARVLIPSQGKVLTRGLVAPLIELGAGFHPDMTGRENAILYGTILGRSAREMRNRVDDIADWAGLGKFIDLPVRTYSSGMLGRLSFAVATDRVPEILIIDEVLSVGDAEFQIKSKKRMMEIIRGSACVVLVSHDLAIIKQMATKAILLDKGQIIAQGKPDYVVSEYSDLLEKL